MSNTNNSPNRAVENAAVGNNPIENTAVENDSIDEGPKLRVAYLTGEFPRATDTFIQREIAALRSQGHEVHTFAVRRPGTEHLVGPEQREGQATTSYLLELAKTGQGPAAHLKLLVKSPKRYAQGLKLAWVTRRPGAKGGLYQLFYFAEAAVLATEMKEREIDHLHNHFGDSSCSVAMLASELAGIPFSFTLHGAAIFFEAHTWRLDEKLRRAAFCSCISYFARSQAAVFAPETIDDIHIVHCGVEPDRMTPVHHNGAATKLLFVGRMADAKGVIHLFDAMAELKDRTPNLRLTMVGDGPDRGRFEREAKKRNVNQQIDFVGSKSQQEVAALLADHEIFVLPSYAEGLPVVLMEALGSGLAAISTNVGGVSELIEDGVTGLLARPGNAEDLVNHIEKLVNDPGLRQKLGESGRAKVLAEFDSSIEAAKLSQHFVAAQATHSLRTAKSASLPSG